MRNQRAFKRCIDRLLGSYIEMDSLTKLKGVLRSAIVSEFSAMYPPKEVRYLLGITTARIDQLTTDVQDVEKENRSTHWVIRSALHDLKKHKFKSLGVSVKLFSEYLCENALEECENIKDAMIFLNCGERAIRENADCSMYPTGEIKRKATRRKKKWWEK